jgi:hypothetical protein
MVGVHPYPIAQARFASAPRPVRHLGNFVRTLVMLKIVEPWSLPSPAAEAVKIGVVSHDRYVAFKMAT